MKTSIIISVYKNHEALFAVLEALHRQTILDFEIIISEDGNDPQMKHFVDNYNWFCPYQHLTQPDEGWRKNRALNRAVLAAKNPWLIFLDGDCVPHRSFVEMHLASAAPDRILLGKRVKLSESLSNNVLHDIDFVDTLSSKMWFLLFSHNSCRYPDEGIFLPYFLANTLRSTRHLIGCNMSFHRDAIVRINGFDEDYTSPATGEDADIAWRLRTAGYQFVSVRNRAIVYHLHHKENWTDQTDNLNMMKRKIKSNQFVCTNGINLHL